MSLLAGIVGSTIPQVLSGVSAYDASDTGSGSMSITGANAGNIYVLIHHVLKASGTSVTLTSPTGFSGTGRSELSERFAYRISYKYLTSNETTLTIPAVTNAQAQTALGFVISDVNASYSSLSNPFNDAGYIASGDPAQLSTSVIFNDTALGGFAVLDDSSGAFDGSVVVDFDLSGSKLVTSSATSETLYGVAYVKIFDSFVSDTASFDPLTESTPTLTTLNIIRPA
jgi:hypothetical protein